MLIRSKIMVGAGVLAFLVMALVSILLLFCIPSCAASAKIASIETNLNKLEKVVDNKVDADKIDELRQQLFEVNRTLNNSGIIKYSGAGWVVVGTGFMAIIFLSAIGLTVKFYLKASTNTSLLGLVTTAVKKIDPETQIKIKNAIKSETKNGGRFSVKHRNLLTQFTKNNGTFIEK